MFCGECGQSIESNSRFCRYCGVAQEVADRTDNSSNHVAGASSVADLAVRTTTHATIPLWLRWGFGAVGVLIVLAVLIPSPKPAASNAGAAGTERADTSDTAETDAMAAAAAAAAAADTARNQAASNWNYRADDDKVRNATTYFATTTSTNRIFQNQPYDAETTMDITLRQSPREGTDVILTISSGQMMCPSYEGCTATARFDDGPAQTIGLLGPSDNSSETVFVNGAKSFIAKLRKAKHVVIEKTLYQAGNPQFEFAVEGLKWDY